jgi:hypothetical protein
MNLVDEQVVNPGRLPAEVLLHICERRSLPRGLQLNIFISLLPGPTRAPFALPSILELAHSSH